LRFCRRREEGREKKGRRQPKKAEWAVLSPCFSFRARVEKSARKKRKTIAMRGRRLVSQSSKLEATSPRRKGKGLREKNRDASSDLEILRPSRGGKGKQKKERESWKRHRGSSARRCARRKRKTRVKGKKGAVRRGRRRINKREGGLYLYPLFRCLAQGGRKEGRKGEKREKKGNS